MSTDPNPYAAVASVYQDLERMKFAQDLRKNPGDYSSYVNTRVDQMTDEIFNRKRVAFQKAQIDLGRYMDMDHNANFYKSRSADVDNLTDQISANNKRIESELVHDKDLSKRQFEINEWSNYNKLETLFFLQVFFLASLCMAVIIYLQKTSMIAGGMAALLTGGLVAIVAIVGIYRYYYTNRTRDTRLWHRRTFDVKVEAPPAPPKCNPDGTLAFDLNSLIPKGVTQCLDGAANKFESWQKSVEDELSSFQESGTTPSRMANIGGTLSGLVCGK